MIGLVGPRDSVALVLEVAREMRLADQIVARTYARLSEAPVLAGELRGICRALLFTGRAPYLLRGSTDGWAVGAADLRADFIPHGGADLYRTIGALLLLPRFRSSFPSLSIDSIEASDVAEAFDDLGLAAPRHVIPLTLGGEIEPDHVTREHLRLFRTGEVQHCLTCIGVVHEALRRAKVPVLRIVHSRVVIRESLQKARLAVDLGRAEASQVAACVVYLNKARLRAAARRSSPRALLLVARGCAEALDGRIVRQAGHEVVVLATRGAAERCIRAGALPGAALPKRLSSAITIGIGYGASASIAEEQGRRAADEAVARSGPLSVANPARSRQRRTENLRALQRLKVSPTLTRRLIDVFTSLDPESFTAHELAGAYRLSPRSARRLISLLRAQKLVAECGIDKRDGPGRPTRVYRIALSRLTEALPDDRTGR